MFYKQTQSIATATADYAKIRLGDKLIAYAVKHYRDKEHITQKQLAFFCKLSPKLIQDIENGFVKPQIKTLQKLAKYFRIDYLQLLMPLNHALKPEEALEIPDPTIDTQRENTTMLHTQPPIRKNPGVRKTPWYSDPHKMRHCLRTLNINNQTDFMKLTGLKESTFSRLQNKIINIQDATYEALTVKLGLRPEEMLLEEADLKRHMGARKKKDKRMRSPLVIRAPFPNKEITTYKTVPQGQMSLSDFIQLVTKIGKLTDANKKFVLEMVDKLEAM
jgi:transcriptional regulator with XRE-family HTH domain